MSGPRLFSERGAVSDSQDACSVSLASRIRLRTLLTITTVLIGLADPGAPLTLGAGQPSADSCIECHGNPTFRVTNPKLFDYYQRWQQSVHCQEGLSCADCHGGNPKAAEKEQAHRSNLKPSEPASLVNFQNIATTCAECHADIYDGFRQSKHFKQIVAKDQDAQGPNCVTCHGSVNASVVNIHTVEKTCAACHNSQSQNHPELPAQATELLYRLLSAQRFYRYVSTRGNPIETKPFLEMADHQLQLLAVKWHTFDLPAIRKDTESILALLRAKRHEIGRNQKK